MRRFQDWFARNVLLSSPAVESEADKLHHTLDILHLALLNSPVPEIRRSFEEAEESGTYVRCTKHVVPITYTDEPVR